MDVSKQVLPSRVIVDVGVMDMKWYSTSPKAEGMEFHQLL